MKLTKEYLKGLVKESLTENKISKTALDKIIKEEYENLKKEAHGDKSEIGGDFKPPDEIIKKVFKGAFPFFVDGEIVVKSVEKSQPHGEYRSATLTWASYTPFRVTLEAGSRVCTFDIDVTQLSKVPEDLKKYYEGKFVTRAGQVVDGDFLYSPNYTSLSATVKQKSEK
jgi:hypothetical protein